MPSDLFCITSSKKQYPNSNVRTGTSLIAQGLQSSTALMQPNIILPTLLSSTRKNPSASSKSKPSIHQQHHHHYHHNHYNPHQTRKQTHYAPPQKTSSSKASIATSKQAGNPTKAKNSKKVSISSLPDFGFGGSSNLHLFVAETEVFSFDEELETQRRIVARMAPVFNVVGRTKMME